jgi:hypothetical protein
VRLTSSLFLLVAASAIRAEPKDVAKLFPAKSVVYVEVAKPGAAANDLAAFLKGTVFENALPALNKLKEKQRPNGLLDTTEAGLLSAFLGPEMLKEAGRFQGLAAGITGFDKNGEPEFLAAVLTGESQLPGFIMRAFLSAHPDIRKVATVEGIDLYQDMQVQFFEDPLIGPGALPPVRQAQPVGSLYAYEPGLILVGTSKDQVSAAIRRFKGKDKSPALTAAAEFKEAAAQRDKPGLFIFADAKALLGRLDDAIKEKKDANDFALRAVRRLLPAASVRTVVALLELRDGGFDMRCRLKLDSKSPSTLAELLDGQALAAMDLNCLAKDSPLAVMLKLPAGEKRLPRLLTVLDSVIKSTGTLGPTASEIVQELEAKKLLSARDLSAVSRVSLVMPAMTTWPKNAVPVPVLLVHADSTAVLAALEAAMPAVFEMLGAAKGDAVTETIDSANVRTLEAKASPTGTQIHYAQHGSALAIGTDRKLLAACLVAAAAKSYASVDEVAEPFKSSDARAAVAIINWPELLGRGEPDKAVAKRPIWDGTSSTIPFDALVAPGTYVGGRGSWREVPRDVLKQFTGLPPLVVTLGRQGDELRFELHQRDPKSIRAKAIDRWFDWYIRSAPRGFYPGDIIDGTSNGPIPFGPPTALPPLPQLIPPPPP